MPMSDGRFGRWREMVREAVANGRADEATPATVLAQAIVLRTCLVELGAIARELASTRALTDATLAASR